MNSSFTSSNCHNATFAIVAPAAKKSNGILQRQNSMFAPNNKKSGISLRDLTSRSAPVDMNLRRTISDSVLSSSGRGGGPSSYNRIKTYNMMVSRSGGKTVSLLINSINERCEKQESQSSSATAQQHAQAPEEEFCTLAQWSADSYYRIVMVSRNGIPAILRAMNCFPENRAIQECGCICLSNLCQESPKQQVIIEESGGVTQIILAMKHHSQSIAVQSAACDALRSLSGLILSADRASEDTKVVAHEQQTKQLLQVLGHAKKMYLHPVHLAIAEELYTAMTNVSCSASQA